MTVDTIAAICTPLAEGGVSAVRISGPKAIEIAEKIFVPKSRERSLSRLNGYTAAFGAVYDGEERLDEAVALVFRAPKSYTGEDTVELSVHGGVYLIQRVLRAALAAGARAALGGEFTKRAFLNGKLDLTEAEAVMGLVQANGKQALQISVRNKEGAIFKKITEIADGLLFLASQIAVFSDYPEDDTLTIDQKTFIKGFETAKEKLAVLMQNYDRGRLLTAGINTAIVGSPNAGKSTLMNMLSGTNRSIVTDVAGTTRDVIEQTVRLGELTLLLADTAGIHETGDEVEKIGVAAAIDRLQTADLCIAVFDLSRAPDADDLALLERLKGKNTVVVLNKNDLPRAAGTEQYEKIGACTVELSALQQTGFEQLEKAIAKVLGTAALDPAAEILGSERQYSLVCRAYHSVCEALAALAGGVTLDAVGVMNDDALNALFELSGKRVTDEVADEVFRNFCVGK